VEFVEAHLLGFCDEGGLSCDGDGPVLFHGSRSLLGSRLGLISSACNEDCDHLIVGYTGGLQRLSLTQKEPRAHSLCP
jgi:hypothetical protein